MVWLAGAMITRSFTPVRRIVGGGKRPRVSVRTSRSSYVPFFPRAVLPVIFRAHPYGFVPLQVVTANKQAILHESTAVDRAPCKTCRNGRAKGDTMVFDECRAVPKDRGPIRTQSCTECLARSANNCSLLLDAQRQAEAVRVSNVNIRNFPQPSVVGRTRAYPYFSVISRSNPLLLLRRSPRPVLRGAPLPNFSAVVAESNVERVVARATMKGGTPLRRSHPLGTAARARAVRGPVR
jgi:hypothetical protein